MIATLQPPSRTARLAATVAAAALLGVGCGTNADDGVADDPLLVAAAADLRPAFIELGERFEAATGEPVVFSFGSSGQLAQQLIEGAPMDLYASADAAFVEQVLDAGIGDPTTRETYAFGHVALWSNAERWGGWDALAAMAADDQVTSIAIANPEHAPYGLAARQALESAAVWDAVQPRLVFGENVGDAQRLAASGNADVAIVSVSLAIASGEAGEGRWSLIDDHLHEPMQQDLIVVADDPDRAALAQRFVDHVNSDDGRQVMRRFGLLLPDEDPPETWNG